VSPVAVKVAREKEGGRHLVRCQVFPDRGSSFGQLVGGKDQVNALFRAVHPGNGTQGGIYTVFGCLFLSARGEGSEIVSKAGSPVHGGLIGGVIAVIEIGRASCRERG